MIISGKDLATKIKAEIAEQVPALVERYGRAPHLAVILVGEDPASQTYVRNKGKACEAVGFRSTTIVLPAQTSEEELLDKVRDLNEDEGVDGILIQLPLPKHIDERKAIDAIAKEKDVDGFHPGNVADLWLSRTTHTNSQKNPQNSNNQNNPDTSNYQDTQNNTQYSTPQDNPDNLNPQGNPDSINLQDTQNNTQYSTSQTSRNSSEFIVPCTPRGCMRILEAAGVDPAGKRAVVIGRSNIVGLPVAKLLLNANATVTICHSRTQNLAEETRRADILIAAIGKPKFVTGDMVTEGAVVIDVGINRTPEGKLCGDVDFDSVSPKASVITPVPGGVGPMTICCLMENTLDCYLARINK